MRRKLCALMMALLMILTNLSFAEVHKPKAVTGSLGNGPIAKKKKAASVQAVKKDFFINGVPVTLKVFTKKNVTMVAARDLVDPLGAVLTVKPIENDRRSKVAAVFVSDTHEMGYLLDTTIAACSDGSKDRIVEISVKVGATMINGTTYVPLRTTVERMGGTLTPVGYTPSAQPSSTDQKKPAKKNDQIVPQDKEPVLSGPVDTTMAVGGNQVNVRVLYANNVLMLRFEDFQTIGYEIKKDEDIRTYYFISHQMVDNTVMFVEGKKVIGYVDGDVGEEVEDHELHEKKIKMKPITVNGETYLELQPVLDVMQMKTIGG